MCVKHVGVRDTSLSEKNKIYALLWDFWDWSWQELARFDLSEMMRCIYSTSSNVFVVGHSQGTIMSLAALTQPDIAEEVVEAAALFCSISYSELSLQNLLSFVHYMQRMGRQPFGFDM